MLYNINGCIKEMTEDQKKDYDWAIDPLNPANLPEAPVEAEDPEGYALWLAEKDEKLETWKDKKIRTKRNKKLAESDSYKHLDHPKNIEKGNQAVLDYVQSLRDFPSTFTEVPSDDDKSVVFPEL